MSYKNEIEKLKSELDSLLPMKIEQQEALRKKLRLEFNYNSNHIEGNTLTYGETKLLLLFDETRGNHLSREYDEMKGSDVALELTYDLANDKEKRLTEKFIKELNKILLVKPYWKEAITYDGAKTQRKISVGDYKAFLNNVLLPNGETFEFASPADTPILMGELIEWLKNEEAKKELHPIELAAELHYRFVRIHPFDDGNGRISRLLMNYILLKNDYPLVVIKSDDKKNYLSALHDADAGSFASFVNYIEEQLIWSLELNIKAAKGEPLEEEEDWKKRLSLIQKQLANNETITTTKSLKVLTELINKKIFPTFINIVDSLNNLDGLFLERYLFYVGNVFFGNQRVALSLQIDTNIISSHLQKKMQLEIRFTHFTKLIENPFSLKFYLLFDFENLKYVLTLNNKEKITKLYHQDFTKEEIEAIKNSIGKFVTEEIEKHLSSN